MNIIEQIKALPEETAPMTSIYPEVIRVTVEDLKALAEAFEQLLEACRQVFPYTSGIAGVDERVAEAIERAEKL